MSLVGAGKTVCVTGASGYIAGNIVAQLLEKGYTVKGTVRSLTNTETTDYLTKLPHAAERLKLVEADLLTMGAFDDVVKDCEYVFHTASPFFRRECKPEELVVPALEGTRNVYNACLASKTVKRVVTTSSFATIIFGHDHTKDPKPYNEDSYNEVSKPDTGDTMHTYRYSKVAAEKLGWEIQKTMNPTWDLVTINPPIVIGPWLDGYDRPNESSMIVKEWLSGEKPIPGVGGMGFVDVRDVAAAHIAAAENPQAKGRYLIAGVSLYFPDVAKILSELYPEKKFEVATGGEPVLKPEFDTSKAQRDLGWAPRPYMDTFKAQCDALIKAGMA